MPIVGRHKGMGITIADFDTDTTGYYEAAKQHKLVVKRCRNCGMLRWPPHPGCFWCMSMDWEWQEVSGKGIIYTFEIVEQAIQPGFRDWQPYVTVVVELDECKGAPFDDYTMHRRYGIPHPDIGVRHIANLVREEGGQLVPELESNTAIGKRVEIVFHDSENITMPMWKLAPDSEQPPADQLWYYQLS